MRSIVLLAALFMLAPLVASAEDPPPPADAALDLCVGESSWEIEDPWEELRSIPAAQCEKACKAAIKMCVSTRKAQGKCGKSFIKGVGKIAAPICDGMGGTKSECKFIKDDIKFELELWADVIDAGIGGCYFEGSDCYAACR